MIALNKSTLRLFSYVTLAVVVYSTARASSTKPQQPEAQRLIGEAEIISRSFSPEERADLLLDMLGTPAGTVPDTGKRWSLELFSISKLQLRPGPYRAAIQKNALIDLANVDASEAAKLFKSQDTPDMLSDKVLTEDYRTWAARALFPKLWSQSGMASLPKIKELADWLGSTGEYPFFAMIGIVQGAAKADRVTADGLVSDAVGYYERMSTPFLNRHQEFVPFILGTADYVRPSLVTQCIQAELEVFDKERKNADENSVKFVLQATNSQHTVQFNDEAEYDVYRLLPIINRLDPNWAKEVKDKYTTLKYLPESPDSGPIRTTGVAVMPGESVSNADVAAAMDDHRLFQVSMLANSDPQRAAQIIGTIQDPGRKAVAEATLLGAYSSDPKQASQWRDDAQAELDHLPAGKIKLKLLVALANLAVVQHKQEVALGLFNKAFDLGELLFNMDIKENPGKMAYTVEGEEELASLVTDFCKDNALRPAALDQTRGIHNDVLKAKLLVAAAKGTLSQTPHAE